MTADVGASIAIGSLAIAVSFASGADRVPDSEFRVREVSPPASALTGRLINDGEAAAKSGATATAADAAPVLHQNPKQSVATTSKLHYCRSHLIATSSATSFKETP